MKEEQEERGRGAVGRGQPLVAISLPYRGGWQARAPELGTPLSPTVSPPTLSAYELWKIRKARTALREEYLALWRESAKYTGTGRPVDAIIAPVAPHAACPHGKTPYVHHLL